MELLLIFFWSFLLAYFVIPFVIYMSHTKEILDIPNRRAIHDKLTPRLGGIGIFVGLLGGHFLFGVWTFEVQIALAGSLILFLIGLKDDLVGVPVFQKLLVQLVVAGFMIFVADLRIDSLFGLLGVHTLPYWLSVTLTFTLIIGLTNAVNLVDGIDGLAGSLMVLYCFVFGYFFLQASSPLVFLCMALAGGLLAFLRYNLLLSQVFMGDSGSLISGFLLCVLVLSFLRIEQRALAPFDACAIVIVPVMDTLRVMGIRISQGRSPFSPDRLHMHHRLLALGLKHWQVVAVMLLVSGLFIATVRLANSLSGFPLLGLLLAMAVAFNLLLEFLYKRWGKI